MRDQYWMTPPPSYLNQAQLNLLKDSRKELRERGTREVESEVSPKRYYALSGAPAGGDSEKIYQIFEDVRAGQKTISVLWYEMWGYGL